MTMNLLDLPDNILEKIGEFVNDNTTWCSFSTIYNFKDYGIDIDLKEWNNEIKIDYWDNNYAYDLRTMKVKEYVDTLSIKKIEKIVYKYGFTKALKLFNDTFGRNIEYDDENPEYFIKKILCCIIEDDMIELGLDWENKINDYF